MTAPATEPTATAAPSAHAKGPHGGPQAGILNRPPEHLLLVALDLTGGDPRATIEALRTLVEDELRSELAASSEGQAGETGELGYDAHHDRMHLTITVGFSKAGYTKLHVPEDQQPADLIDIPWADLGDPQPADPASGDLVLQLCADSAYVVEHVLRRIEHELGGQVRVVWAHTGAQRYNSRPGRTARREGRAWIGFLDGTSNLDPKRSEADRALTFVDPDATASYPKTPASGGAGPYGPSGPNFALQPPLREHPGHEPAWTRDGSYLAVRVSLTDLASWDPLTMGQQEQIIGRFKQDGVSLDLAGQQGVKPETPPLFATDQSNTAVPLLAHIRKANPRRIPEDEQRRIFRRGYPLYEGADGGLRRGLIFLAFARTLSTQFEFITRGWLVNKDFPTPGAGIDALRQFDTQVLAGGYYFVPPLEHHTQPWTWVVPPPVAS